MQLDPCRSQPGPSVGWIDDTQKATPRQGDANAMLPQRLFARLRGFWTHWKIKRHQDKAAKRLSELSDHLLQDAGLNIDIAPDETTSGVERQAFLVTDTEPTHQAQIFAGRR